MELLRQHQAQERLFLQELQEELTLIETVVQNLTGELILSQGDIEGDPEAERFFHHVLSSLGKMKDLIDKREQLLLTLSTDSRSLPEYRPQSLGSAEF